MQHAAPPPSADLEMQQQQARSNMLPGAVPDDSTDADGGGGGGEIASPSAAGRTAAQFTPQAHTAAGYTRVHQSHTPMHLSIPMRAAEPSGETHVTAGAPTSPSAAPAAAAAGSSAASAASAVPSAADTTSRKLRADNSKFVRLLSACKRDTLMLMSFHALLSLVLVLVCAAILNLTPMHNLKASTDLVWSTGTIAALASALVVLAAAGMVAQVRRDSAKDPWDAPEIVDAASTNEKLRAKAKAVNTDEQRYFFAGIVLTLALLILGLLLQVFSADLNHSSQSVWDNVDERPSIISHFECCGFTAADSPVPLLCVGVGGSQINTTVSCATPVRQALHTQAQGVSALALVFASILLISLFLWLRFGSIRTRFARAESRSTQEREDDELDSLLDGSLPPDGCLNPRENFVVWQYPDKPRDCSGCCWSITSTRINLRTAPASDQLREAKPLLLNEAQANRLRARLMDGAAELQNRKRACDTAVNISSLITGCIVALLVVIQVLVASTEPEANHDKSAAGFAYIYASLPILAAFIEQCCGQVRKRAMADLADIESSLKLLNAHMEHEFLFPDTSAAAAAPEEAASVAKIIDMFGKLTPDHGQQLKALLDKAHSSASVGTATAGGDLRRLLEGGIGGLGAGFNSGINGLRNELGGALGGLGSNAHSGLNGGLGGLRSNAQSGLADLRGDFSGAVGSQGSNSSAGLGGLRGGLSAEAQQGLQALRGELGAGPLSAAQRSALEALLANLPALPAWRSSSGASALPSNAAAAVADARSAALGMGPEWLSAASAASLSPAHAVQAAALDARPAAINAFGSPTAALNGAAASWLPPAAASAPNAAVADLGRTAQESAEAARSTVASVAPAASQIAPMRVSAPMSVAPPSIVPRPPAAASVAAATSTAPVVPAAATAPWFASQVDPSVQALLDSMGPVSAAVQSPPQQQDPRTPPNARARERGAR